MRAAARRSLPVAALIAGLLLGLAPAAQEPEARPQPAPPALPAPQAAPQRPFLYLNRDEILTGSKAGQALLAAQEAALDKLRVEARAIDAAFEAEERRLTAERATLGPVEFRAKADDFDARVVAARREQDERSNALAQEFEQRRRQFYASVAPILVQFMDRQGAQAIFDEGSILLADQSVNITQAVIAAIDAQMPAAVPEPQAPPPAPAPAEGGNEGGGQ